jgi:ribonuclease D
MTTSGGSPQIIDGPDAVRDLLGSVARATRVGVDLEASGMFAYRARPCTLQLAWDAGASVGSGIAIVDTLIVPVSALADLLGRRGPVKIVHDVAFDARLLAEAGVDLANVHDTAIAARMLGRTATGLATLLESVLGVRIAKDMQHHDWRKRPLDAAGLAYLASDVANLDRLEAALWQEVVEKDIEREVLEETEYRLATAIAAARAPAEGPAYLRMRRVDQLAERELAALRAIAELREDEARRRDVPPHWVMPNEALIEIARRRPTHAEAVLRVPRVPASTSVARDLAGEMARAVAEAGDVLPEEERAHWQRPRVPAALSRAKRERETRLIAWRRAEAKRRGVDEQVVLPGHCVKDATESNAVVASDLARVPGIGAFRIERDGEAILRALRGDGAGT